MSGAITATAVAVGIDAATAAAIASATITGAEIGGGLGFVTNLAEGKGIGQSLIGGLEGAVGGGITGGAAEGLAPVVGGALGIGNTAGGALVGAGTGAATSAAEGQNPLIGAATGAVGGGIIGNDITAPAVPGSVATTGQGGSPTFTPGSVPAPAAPSGGITAPAAVDTLATEDIGTALDPRGLNLDTPLGATGGTNLGSVTGDSTTSLGDIGGAGGGETSLGPVQSTPTNLGSTGANLGPSGTDLSNVVTPPPTLPPGAGLDPTAQANLTAGTPSTPGGSAYGTASLNQSLQNINVPAAVTNDTTAAGQLLHGNLGQAATDVGTFLGSHPTTALEAGFTGLEALQGPAPLSKAGKALYNQGNTLNATANADLAAANAGTLTAPQQATVNQYVQDATNQLYQQLASQGVANPQGDSRFLQGMQQIQQQAATMTAQYVQQTFSNAMSAAGQAASDLGAAATEQTANDNAYSSSLSSAVESIGGMAALSQLQKKAA